MLDGRTVFDTGDHSAGGSMRSDRRRFLGGAAALTATSALASSAVAQGFELGAIADRYPYDIWKVHDPRFGQYLSVNTPLRREWTGALWAEGSAWHGVGRYVVFSDIPNNRQMRWDEVTGRVSLMRSPSQFSNGNTHDFEGRQISCEHSTASVVRYEWEGERTILAEEFEGKKLNAPNDPVVHPDDGGIIFTDPGYGSHGWYEGNKRELELPTSVYHIDAQSGQLTKLTDEIVKPNGVCFSPDYNTLYVADTGPTHDPSAQAQILAWDIQDNGRRLTNRRTFAVLDMGEGRQPGPGPLHDGIRADVDGNIWAGTIFGGEGIDGIHVYAPDGTRIGQILMPESCANLTFVGKHRNRLFICGSQSVYTIYTGAQGAHIS
jgi:gluconolactonase